MLYAFKLCVLTFVVFLAVLTGLVLAVLAWPNGGWGFLNTLMASQSVVMFAAAWYLSGCYRFIKVPRTDEDWRSRSNKSPHTILGQGQKRKEYGP